MLMRVLRRTPIPHSVTQGSLENPCSYLNGSSGAGFDSGLLSGSAKQFTIRITNDQQRRQKAFSFFFSLVT